MSKTPQVIVIWSTPALLEKGIVNFLDSYNGVRIYDKDRLDPRLLTKNEPTLPYFDDMSVAHTYMSANPNKCIQLDLREARRYRLTD